MGIIFFDTLDAESVDFFAAVDPTSYSFNLPVSSPWKLIPILFSNEPYKLSLTLGATVKKTNLYMYMYTPNVNIMAATLSTQWRG